MLPNPNPPRSSALALVSLVLGILSFFLPWVLSLAAVITGHLARAEIRKDGLGGGGLAMGGLVLGYFTILAPCLALGGTLVFGKELHDAFAPTAIERAPPTGAGDGRIDPAKAGKRPPPG